MYTIYCQYCGDRWDMEFDLDLAAQDMNIDRLEAANLFLEFGCSIFFEPRIDHLEVCQNAVVDEAKSLQAQLAMFLRSDDPYFWASECARDRHKFEVLRELYPR